MDLASHFAAMWRHKLVIIAGTFLITVVLYAVISVQPKVYEASAQLNVIAGAAATQQSGLQAASNFLAATYADLAQTQPVLTVAAKDSRLGIDEAEVETRVSVTPSATLGFLTISATGPSPEAATALDTATVTALINAVNTQQTQALDAELAPIRVQVVQLQTELNSLPSTATNRSDVEAQYQAVIQAETAQEVAPLNQINIVAPAQAGGSPVSPKPKSDALLGFLTALVVLAELSVLYEVATDRLSSVSLDAEIKKLTDLPVLAHISKDVGPGQLEAFRTLRTSLLFMDSADQIRTVAIVSSLPGAGKSFVSVNLAIALADLGLSVALVDGDMRRPVISDRLDVPRAPGLSEVLLGGELSTAIHYRQTYGGGNLLVLPAGSPVADPAGLLSSQLPSRVFSGLTNYQVVLVDTPAESLFPDTAVIASHCDAVIVVVDAGSAKRLSLKALLERLRQVQAKPFGVVVNRANVSTKGAEHYSRVEDAEPQTT